MGLKKTLVIGNRAGEEAIGVSSEMRGNMEDDDDCRACAECARICQGAHGVGAPRTVPRFSRLVPDYSLPSAKECNMQVPAFFVREHAPDMKGQCFLVGVTGAQWEVNFKEIGFKEGWKLFASDYKLEKGDLLTFALVAPRRFCVNVFDKFGMEKTSAGASPSTAKAPQLDPRNKSPVSNFMSGTQALKPNAISSGKSSEKNGDHGEQLSPLSRKRPHEAMENFEAEHFPMSESSGDSAPVRLAKEVLRNARQKKELKKRKMSCRSSPQVEAFAEAGKSGGMLGIKGLELCENLENGDEALEVKSVEDMVDKGVAILSGYVDPAGSPRGDDNGTMFEKPPHEDCRVGASNDDEAAPDVGHEPPVEAVGQKSTPTDERQNEATETVRGATGEDSVLKEPEKPQAVHVFQAGLVKQEPGIETNPPQGCKNCASCGRRREPRSPFKFKELKSEPVASENPETPDVKTTAPSTSASRVTEDQKQRALIAAKILSATTTNRHAIVVMRVSYDQKTHNCFVSLKCAEMLPPEAAELIFMDSDGVQCRVHWNADIRHFQGPGWNDFVTSHNLRINDVFVLEVLENSPQRFVVLVHIFRAHEMENAPLQPPSRAGRRSLSSTLVYGSSPLSNSKRTKAAEAAGAKKPSSSSPPTSGRARAAAVTPPPPNKRLKASAPDAVATRPKRTPSSSLKPEPATPAPATPAPAPKSGGGEQAKVGERAKQKAVRERHNLYSPHLRRMQEMKASKATTDGPEKQVRTRNSRAVQYPVAKMLERRKTVQGLLFLVELGKPVSQSIIHKGMKCKQVGKGRWWVPHHHFTKDFISCFIE